MVAEPATTCCQVSRRSPPIPQWAQVIACTFSSRDGCSLGVQCHVTVALTGGQPEIGRICAARDRSFHCRGSARPGSGVADEAPPVVARAVVRVLHGEGAVGGG